VGDRRESSSSRLYRIKGIETKNQYVKVAHIVVKLIIMVSNFAFAVFLMFLCAQD
jgi:hypothetical protein